MRILLVHPRSRSIGEDQTGDWPPIWAARISAALKSAGFLDIGLLDTAAKPMPDRALRSMIAEDAPDLVIVNAAAGACDEALRLADMAKALHPAAVALVTGAHASLNPRRLLAQSPAIDVIAEDHDEEALVEVARSIERGHWFSERREIAGLAFAERGGSQSIVTVTARSAARPRSTRRPDWSLLDWSNYVYRPLGRRCAIIDLSFGGDLRCVQCGDLKPNGERRGRDPQAVVDEIATLFHTYDVRFFRLSEAGRPPAVEDLIDLCQVLKARGLAPLVNFAMTLGPEEVLAAEEHLGLFRQGGALHVTVDLEYGRACASDGAPKTYRRADVKRAMRLLRDAGIVAELRVPLTLEADSLKTVDESLRLAIECAPDLVAWVMPDNAGGGRVQGAGQEALECLNARVCDRAIRPPEAPVVDRALLLEKVMSAYKRFREELVVSTHVDDARGRYISQHLKATLEATFGPSPMASDTVAYWDVDPNPLRPAEPRSAAATWLSPGAGTPRVALAAAPQAATPEPADLMSSLSDGEEGEEGGATVHPLAIVKLIEALRLSGLDRFVQPIFNAAGEPAWPARPPTMPIGERRVARVHQALHGVLLPDLARQVLVRAGRLTADELIEERVSRRTLALAALLPSAISNLLLVVLIRRNSGTVMGSGVFEARAGQPTVFERRGNPLCAGVKSDTPRCAFHTAVIRQLFRAFVSRSVEVVETQCEACGDPCCRYVVAWGSASRQKKMFERLGIDPGELSKA